MLQSVLLLLFFSGCVCGQCEWPKSVCGLLSVDYVIVRKAVVTARNRFSFQFNLSSIWL